MTVRLFLDGSKILWAHVRCDVCTDVNKHLASEAAQELITCKTCGHSMDVRGQVMTDATHRPDVTGEMLITLSGVRRPRSSDVLDR
jgi:hypothetical protein